MREIKFKVFLKFDEKYVKELVDEGEDYFPGIMLDTEFKVFKRDAGIMFHEDYVQMLSSSNPPEVIWLQYTGLKDKNGVEIYEGDILICESNEYHSVIFESYFACFNTKHLNSGEVSDITRDEMSECFTLAGNIHENPELLNR